MSKVIFLQGIPGSGKSTYARRLLEQGEGKIHRINKDDLRAQLDDGKWSKTKEKLIRQAEEVLAEMYLKAGHSVIIDSTNGLSHHKERFQELAKRLGADFETVFLKVPLEECIRRDSLRKGKERVGLKVIENIYKDFEILYKDETIPFWEDDTAKEDTPMYRPDEHKHLPEAVMVDIDGTVAAMMHRGPFEWHRVHEDEVHWDVVEVVRWAYNHGKTVIVMSGRDASCKELTEKWLKAHEIPYHEIHMRPEGDSRKDSIVKRELFECNVLGKYRVTQVFDDRDQVVSEWRKMGLRVFQVAEGNF